MAIYDYKAKTITGQQVSGIVEAVSLDAAAELMKDKQLVILELTERKKKITLQVPLGFLNRISNRERVIFARQLSVMISTAVPIVQALRILIKQTKSVAFKIIISEISDDVDGGAKLSEALSRYPQVFSEFFVHMIRSGETTGKLDETLNYLADQEEKDYDLRSRIKGALLYPAFVLAAMFIVGFLMMIFVIPRLTSILTESGVELPFTTKILISSSEFLQGYWWLVILLLIALSFLFRTVRRSEFGRRRIDQITLRLPIFGEIFKKIYLTRLTRSFSTLIAGGLPITQSLEIVADVVGNQVYRDITRQTIRVVEDGDSIATLYARSRDVPAMLSQMMSVGETTGKLDTILGRLSDFYALEVDNSVRNLVSLLEPFVFLVLGVGVAILVTAILLPMYSLSSAL